MIQRANTILYCQKWAETVAFYRDTLALSVAFENEWFVEFELGQAGFLSIANEERATIKTANGLGLTLAWQVANVNKWRTKLVRKGINCTPTKTKWGAQATYFYDPEGHRIELWQPLQ